MTSISRALERFRAAHELAFARRVRWRDDADRLAARDRRRADQSRSTGCSNLSGAFSGVPFSDVRDRAVSA